MAERYGRDFLLSVLPEVPEPSPEEDAEEATRPSERADLRIGTDGGAVFFDLAALDRVAMLTSDKVGSVVSVEAGGGCAALAALTFFAAFASAARCFFAFSPMVVQEE